MLICTGANILEKVLALLRKFTYSYDPAVLLFRVYPNKILKKVHKEGLGI